MQAHRYRWPGTHLSPVRTGAEVRRTLDDSLEAHLRKHGGLRVAEDLGLLRRPESGEGGRPLREFFAGRVVVPKTRGSQPIWFIGRSPSERQVK